MEGTDSRKTYYIGNVEVVIKSTGLIEYKRYIGDSTISTIRNNGTSEKSYLYRDHIDSISVIAGDDGQLKPRLSYDAFGKRRNGASFSPIQDVFADISIRSALLVTEKGFTGHEHVDHADIIHMGGRIYDQSVGRFVQADPIVQAPENAQSLNRYTYVFNNPLSRTDPTGYTSVGACEPEDARGSAQCRPPEVENEMADAEKPSGNANTAQDNQPVQEKRDNGVDDGVSSGATSGQSIMEKVGDAIDRGWKRLPAQHLILEKWLKKAHSQLEIILPLHWQVQSFL